MSEIRHANMDGINVTPPAIMSDVVGSYITKPPEQIQHKIISLT